jgi:hypothetical protein
MTMAGTSPLTALLLALLLSSSCAVVLSGADYSNFQTSSTIFGPNFVGVSLNFSQIYSAAMSSTLFMGLLANSKAFGSFNSQFALSVKTQWPKGYKYNCTQYSSLGFNATCLFNYSSINAKITTFAKAAGANVNGQVIFGFDMENANLGNANFLTILTSYASAMQTVIGSGFYTTPVEPFDEADNFAAQGIIANYSATNFVSDVTAILGASGAATPIYGPGITQAADPSWLNTFNLLKGNSVFFFTVKAVVFNASTPTIDDLLNEVNYREFILKRFTYDGQILNPATGNIVITELKITSGVGVSGVTNSFASALWAIDSAIEFAMFGGKGVRFPCDISAGNLQTILGPAPGYLPTPLYYGLLFLTSLSYISPQVGMPLITAGSSSSIKAYGFLIPTQLQIVLINKDTNPNASGVVNVTVNSTDYIKCLYLTAPSLSATSGVTWMGYSFISGNSVPQGNYTYFM